MKINIFLPVKSLREPREHIRDFNNFRREYGEDDFKTYDALKCFIRSAADVADELENRRRFFNFYLTAEFNHTAEFPLRKHHMIQADSLDPTRPTIRPDFSAPDDDAELTNCLKRLASYLAEEYYNKLEAGLVKIPVEFDVEHEIIVRNGPGEHSSKRRAIWTFELIDFKPGTGMELHPLGITNFQEDGYGPGVDMYHLRILNKRYSMVRYAIVVNHELAHSFETCALREKHGRVALEQRKNCGDCQWRVGEGGVRKV